MKVNIFVFTKGESEYKVTSRKVKMDFKKENIKLIQPNLESEHLKPVSYPRWKGQSYEVYDRGGRHLSKHKLDLALSRLARIS